MARRTSTAGFAAGVLVLGLLAGAPPRAGTQPLRYEVWTGRGPVRVTLSVTGVGEGRLRVALPRLGRRRSFGRFVQGLAAEAAGGRGLPVRPVGPSEWVVETGRTRSVTLRYRLASWRTRREGAGHVFWPALSLLYWVGREALPAALRFHLPPGWRAAPGLPFRDGWFQAPDVATLYDHPALLGRLTEHPFQVDGVPYRLVFSRPPPGDPGVLARRLAGVAAWYRQLFGWVPFRRYTFLFALVERSHHYGYAGGSASFHAVAGPDLFGDDPEVQGRLARSLFQAWNGRAIRPVDALPPPCRWTYRSQARWFVAGVSEYYALRALVRTGRLSPEGFFRLAARRLEYTLLGRGRAAAARRRPWSRSAHGGFALALTLDVELRRLTRGRKSLDDVLRFLAWWFGREGRPYDANRDLRRAVSAVAARDMSPFFHAYVTGTRPPPVEKALRLLGYRVRRVPNVAGAVGRLLHTLAEARVELPGGTLGRLHRRNPLARAGLRAGDRLVSLGGVSLGETGDLETLARRLQEAWQRAGTVPATVPVRFTRGAGGEVREARLRLRAHRETIRLERDPAAAVPPWLAGWFRPGAPPQRERR